MVVGQVVSYDATQVRFTKITNYGLGCLLYDIHFDSLYAFS